MLANAIRLSTRVRHFDKPLMSVHPPFIVSCESDFIKGGEYTFRESSIRWGNLSWIPGAMADFKCRDSFHMHPDSIYCAGSALLATLG